MNLFEIALFDLAVMICPILLYIIYIFFNTTIDKNKNELFFDIALISSFYLLFKFGINEYNDVPLLFFDILLILAYLSKRKFNVILLSILLIVYYNKNGMNINLLIIEYILYFILNLFSNKIKVLSFIDLFLCFKIFIFYNSMYFDKILNYYSLNKKLDFILLMIIFYFISKFLIHMYKKTMSICSLYKSIDNIERDKSTKESLFKITHEIKNPIAVVKGYLDMFDVNNKEHSKKYIPIMKEEINRVLILLQDFLSITKISIEKEEMDLSLLLEDIVCSFNIMLRNKNIKLNYNPINELYINADYNRLKQVLVNVLKNSMEAIEYSGKIDIKVVKYKSNFKIIVSDNGIGMSTEELEKIKEAFFTTKKNGTGLGIYLSNDIIKKHNGKMIYDSIKDKGTKVTITLPI